MWINSAIPIDAHLMCSIPLICPFSIRYSMFFLTKSNWTSRLIGSVLVLDKSIIFHMRYLEVVVPFHIHDLSNASRRSYEHFVQSRRANWLKDFTTIFICSSMFYTLLLLYRLYCFKEFLCSHLTLIAGMTWIKWWKTKLNDGNHIDTWPMMQSN